MLACLTFLRPSLLCKDLGQQNGSAEVQYEFFALSLGRIFRGGYLFCWGRFWLEKAAKIQEFGPKIRPSENRHPRIRPRIQVGPVQDRKTQQPSKHRAKFFKNTIFDIFGVFLPSLACGGVSYTVGGQVNSGSLVQITSVEKRP